MLMCYLDMGSTFMLIKRRILIAASTALFLVSGWANAQSMVEPKAMYGVIGKIKTKPGQRDALASILLKSTKAMPGCLSYIVAADPDDADALWVTEVWDSADSHKASLSLPEVKAAISAGRPLISGFGERFETRPVGGYGATLKQ